jgi:Leucine-rich repeat (LRR) protein
MMRFVAAGNSVRCATPRCRTLIMTPPEEQSINGKRPRPEPIPTPQSREASQLARPQPSAENESHSQPIAREGSMKRDIPTDIVQNTAEYLGRVTSFLSFRGVSTEWQSAVCDAVGYLNDRCWTRVELGKFNHGVLWTSLRVDEPIVVGRCAVLCLRPRLETVNWFPSESVDCPDNIGGSLPLKLLGENNTTLTMLKIDSNALVDSAHLIELRGLKCLRLQVPTLEDSMVPLIGTLQALEVLDLTHPVTDLQGLRGLTALRELTLSSTSVTNGHFAGLEHVLAGLHSLDLSRCNRLTAITNLAPCVSLRKLNLARSDVHGLQGLEKLVALETLDVTDICTNDFSILRHCPRLVTVSAGIYHFAHSLDDVQAVVDSTAHCLVKWSGFGPHSFVCCTALRALHLRSTDNVSIGALAEIPALEILDLNTTFVRDVSALACCRALRDLSLFRTRVTDAGIAGLERINTLEKLNLCLCHHLSSVTNLRHCTALRELNLGCTAITDAGIEGLGRISTLTTLSLDQCNMITSVSTLRHSPSLRELRISCTKVTGAGISGLEEIVTLERLDASNCDELDDVTSLRRCRALRILDLERSSVTDTSVAALAYVVTLESLCLARCAQIRNVSGFSGVVSLRELNLSETKVDNVGIAGLERCPALTRLHLCDCKRITDVRHLIRSKSLRRLGLSGSPVTDAGIVGIEKAPALQLLELHKRWWIADIAAMRRRAAEHAVKVQF